jgi:hypothetical protein
LAALAAHYKELSMRFKPIAVNIAIMDYNAAVASAVAWLGNRYLLATPVRRLPGVERYMPNLTAAPDLKSRFSTTNNDLILRAERPHAENK